MRRDAIRAKDVLGMEQISIDLKPQRCISNVYINQKLDVTILEKYLKKKKKENPDITYFHLFMTALGKVIYNRPKINRFVADRHIWIHKDVVIVDEPEPTETKYLDGSTYQLLDTSTNMKYNGIVIQAFKLNESTINCRIFSLNEKINFDEEEYYLEIYSNSLEKIAAIKLSGVYDFTPKDTILTAGGLTFNTNFKYFGKMVKMTDATYPDITYTKNEQEIGSFVCSNNNHIIKYTFKNDYLLSIEETYKFVKSDYDDSAYLELYSEYQTKSTNLGAGISSTEEDADGFTFKASLDLEHGYKIPETVTDNNYYEKDSKAKVIHYAETGKGFDCK